MLASVKDPTVAPKLQASMWWAASTITAVGYGDLVPVLHDFMDGKWKSLEHADFDFALRCKKETCDADSAITEIVPS